MNSQQVESVVKSWCSTMCTKMQKRITFPPWSEPNERSTGMGSLWHSGDVTIVFDSIKREFYGTQMFASYFKKQIVFPFKWSQNHSQLFAFNAFVNSNRSSACLIRSAEWWKALDPSLPPLEGMCLFLTFSNHIPAANVFIHGYLNDRFSSTVMFVNKLNGSGKRN